MREAPDQGSEAREDVMSSCADGALINNKILNASYDLLLREAEREGLTVGECYT
jgi:hypothetical protein